jgi:hypothetical protein
MDFSAQFRPACQGEMQAAPDIAVEFFIVFPESMG